MRKLFVVMGLLVWVGCSVEVEMPPQQKGRSDAPVVSPAVTVPHGEFAGMLPMGTPEPAAEPPGRTIAVGSNRKIEAPKSWVPKRPKMGMIQNEFAVPAAEGDENDGRVTVMTVGGSIDANVQRWFSQFTQPDGSDTAKAAKVEKIKAGGCEVHLVDLPGTFRESRGMMGPVVERPDYRMLAAIIVTDEGNWFIKFYGPQKTVEAQAKAFRAMVESLGK